MRVYSESKLANVLFARGLKNRCPGLEVVATHPGFTATDLQRHSFRFRILGRLLAQSVEHGALNNVRAAVDENLGKLGPSEWLCPSGPREMKGDPAVCASVRAYANDEAAQDKLWQLSEVLTGVTLSN
jgi:NAD(P)-dependent dehydrogenase (short-subunit alcohol dehydrogenase family)